jgi:hypothetical protein
MTEPSEELDFEVALRRLQLERAAQLQAAITSIDAMIDSPDALLVLGQRPLPRNRGHERHGIPLPGPNAAVLPLEDVAAEWLDVGLDVPGLEVIATAAKLHPLPQCASCHGRSSQCASCIQLRRIAREQGHEDQPEADEIICSDPPVSITAPTLPQPLLRAALAALQPAAAAPPADAPSTS